jgi:hypothetical protein
LNRFIAFSISTGVKALTSGDSWQGAFMSAAMSSSLFLSDFGVKILSRSSPNRIDFSLVELAQLLSGFLREVWELSAFQIFLLPSILNVRLLKVL